MEEKMFLNNLKDFSASRCKGMLKEPSKTFKS